MNELIAEVMFFEGFPSEDVAASRADKRLQRSMRAEVEHARNEHEGLTCPTCGSDDLAWFGFRSPDWTWGLALCGQQGPLAMCDACQRQVGYFGTLES